MPDPLKRVGRRLTAFLAALAFLLAATLALRTFVLEPFRIASPSMEPALLGEAPGRPGDTILVNRLAYLASAPARWEVVVFRAVGEPPSQAANIVKRIVGLPGEKVAIDGGEVVIDDVPVVKPPHLRGVEYVGSGSTASEPVRLGPDEYFVLGDNSYPSVDSRRFGPLPRANIIGRAGWIVWPWDRLGRIR